MRQRTLPILGENKRQNIFLISVLFVLISGFSYSQTEQTNLSLEKKLHIGEEFTYLAKYAFINLGELRIKVYAKDKINGNTIYKSIACIDSYEGLPFVNLHQIYESWFDSTFCPVYFEAHIFNEKDTSYTKYYFRQTNDVHVLRGKLNRPDPSMDTVININGKYLDGLSLLFYARFNPDGQDTSIIKCFINEDTTTTFVNYYNNKDYTEIEVLDYEIESYRIDGEAGFIGIFGLTGFFEGWFSDDEYRIPLSANLQVIIGSISIELMDWNRNIWQPPGFDK